MITVLVLLSGCNDYTKYRGSITIYSAAWCSSCRELVPQLMDASAKVGYEFRYHNLEKWQPADRYIPAIPVVEIWKHFPADYNKKLQFYGYMDRQYLDEFVEYELELIKNEAE